MNIALWIVIGFCSGSIPFSYWLGKLFLHTDIRRYGDGNPGAFNAWRAGKYKIGLPSLFLDYLKGAIPIGLARYVFNIYGWELVPIALSPVLGHAFSPFLRFRGGKAVASTFGIWTGLTLWEGPTILGIFLEIAYRIQKTDAWSVIISMICLLIYLSLRQYDSVILMIWLGNMLILIWKHRQDLRQGIKWRFHIRSES
ncbi:TPA: glycerol-3-phosphate acyltransferase [Candidatus Poribacteria bacterium]|nr:glycerol-3-phosphate acyltransferase [Candidatus Poribacteria bacterium]